MFLEVKQVKENGFIRYNLYIDGCFRGYVWTKKEVKAYIKKQQQLLLNEMDVIYD